MMLCNGFLMKNKMFIFVFLLFTFLKFCVLSSQDDFSSVFTKSSREKLKILAVFHHPGKSHFDFFKPLLQELARKGHEMTVVSYFPRNVNLTNTEVLPNYKDINLYGSLDKWINVIDLTIIDNNYSIKKIVQGIFMIRQWGLDACEAGLNIPEVRQLIKSNKKFDLILIESFNTDCFLGFVHRFQAPFIALSSHQIMPWVNQQIGNPDNPSYIPSIFLEVSPQMNFLQRITNTVLENLAKILFNTVFLWPAQKMVEETFGPGVPPLDEIAKTTSAVLTNTHYSLFGARPFVPNVVEVGGLHIKPAKPLPEDIKKFLDEASEGVLLFSWGSMVKASSLPKEKLEVILNVISSIPRKVIWKWEVDELPKRPRNLFVTKWLPQFDIMSEYRFLLTSF